MATVPGHVAGEVVLREAAAHSRRLGGRWDAVLAYLEVTKPKSAALLVFTALVGMLVAASERVVPLGPAALLWGLAAIAAGCGGCNALTCYIDRDVDRVMERTHGRPLPMGRIEPQVRALALGLLLVAASLILAAAANPVALAFMALGIVDNVVVYSLWLKRRSPWNIVIGGFSGGMPVAFGWAFVTGGVEAAAILLAALVVLWTPTHIWSLALRYREDYARARIPMLPVVARERTAVRCMVCTAALLVPLSLLLPWATPAAGPGYVAVAGAFGVPVLLLNLWLGLRPSRERAWVVFKFSSPYLAVVFLALLLDTLL